MTSCDGTAQVDTGAIGTKIGWHERFNYYHRLVMGNTSRSYTRGPNVSSRLVIDAFQIIPQTLDDGRGFRRLGRRSVLGHQDRLLRLDQDTSICLKRRERSISHEDGSGGPRGTRPLLAINMILVTLESDELLSAEANPAGLCCFWVVESAEDGLLLVERELKRGQSQLGLACERRWVTSYPCDFAHTPPF